ncbi:ankyrin repeat-containing domain protein [Aspergillus crustosus]
MRRSEHRAPIAHWKEQLLQTAVLLSSFSRAVDLNIIQTLVDMGADVFARDESQKNAIDLVLRGMELEPSNLNRFHVLSSWLPRHQAVSAILLQQDPHFWPMGHINRQLWETVRGGFEEHGQLGLLSLLIRMGKAANEVSGEIGYSGFTALHYLCESFWWIRPSSELPDTTLQMIQILLDHGASISALDDSGHTPLHLAVSGNKTEIVRLLLDHRPDDPAVNIVSIPEGNTPLLRAAKQGNARIMKRLLEAGADILATNSAENGVLEEALEESDGSLAAIEVAIEAGCPVSRVHPQTGSLLHLAVSRGFSSAIKILLDEGCSPYVKCQIQHSGTEIPVLSLAISHDFDVLGELLRCCRRKLVKAEGKRGEELICAAARGYSAEAKMRLLRKYGAPAHDICVACRDDRGPWENMRYSVRWWTRCFRRWSWNRIKVRIAVRGRT